MPASEYIGNMILNATLRGVAGAVPTRTFVSLHTDDPTLPDANEVTTEAWPTYARQDPAQSAAIDTGFSVPVGKTVSNSKKMDYGVMNGLNPVVITHFGIWDAATEGNLLIYGAMSGKKVLAPTDECLINPDNLMAMVA